MWVLQGSQVCFLLLESQGISACRNKCASSSISVWERKSIWGGAIHLLLWPSPIISSQFLPAAAQAALLLLRGSSWTLYISTLRMCKLSSSINRELAVNMIYLPWQSPTEKKGSQVIGLGPWVGFWQLLPKDSVWNVQIGFTESVIPGLVPGYDPPLYHFLHFLLGCAWMKTNSTDNSKDLAG